MNIKENVGHAEQVYNANTEKQSEVTDKLARLVLEDFRIAQRNRSTVKFGDTTAEGVLKRCFDQYYGDLPCDIKEVFGNMPAINLSQLKISGLNAWIRDLIFGSGGVPFTVEPTPIPDLNDEIESEVLGRVKEFLYQMDERQLPQTEEELRAFVKKQKDFIREGLTLKANEAAKAMETVMWDQCIDGNYRGAILQFIQDLCIYPYAVLEGPVPELHTMFEWKGNSLVSKDKLIYAVNRVSPFDFFWSPDSTNTQDGSYVIVRKRYSAKQLFKMAQTSSYISQNVLDAMKSFANGMTAFDWLSNPEDKTNTVWDGKSSLEVLKYYGAIQGKILKEYGMTGLDDNAYYECIIHTLGNYTIKVIINPNPDANKRPIYCTSYEKTGVGIMGFGIAQKVRDVERAFQSCLRGMIKNMEFSSGPIGEVDFSRIQRWIADGEVGELEPYTITPVDPDDFGGGRPAYVFHNVPSNVNALSSVCQWFISLADIVTQIPASIHGQPVGTGANRTFRGMSMLYGNALKGVQSGITNFDEDVVGPFATALYMYNLKFNPDTRIKGDAQVIARGASGLMEKELKKNDMIEAAQIVASLAQTGRVRDETIEKAVNRVLQALDVLDYDLDDYLDSVAVKPDVDLDMLQGQPQGFEDPPQNTDGITAQ